MALKQKVNLTVNGSVLEAAKRVAEERGTSVSSLVEDFLSRIAEERKENPALWLTNFHKKYGILSKREPSDNELDDLRKDLAKKTYMKALFDINIWIDIALRPKSFPEAAELLRAMEARAFSRCLALCSYTTIYYLISKASAPAAAQEFLTLLDKRSTLFLEFTLKEVQVAKKLKFSDFEDACVAATALNATCDIIVTRNIRHFRNSPIPAIEPKALLKEL